MGEHTAEATVELGVWPLPNAGEIAARPKAYKKLPAPLLTKAAGAAAGRRPSSLECCSHGTSSLAAGPAAESAV